MKQLTFDEWARRNHVDKNEDCEECDGIPNSNVKGSCYQTQDDMPVECSRLTKLLEEYHRIKNKEKKILVRTI
jgi:hypothetical protein